MVTARRLWVAGSYARGATECGDLDLILEVSIEGSHPPERSIGSALFGRSQDISLFIGTPVRNTAYIAFPEARLVWAEDAPDWAQHIAAITVDHAATRFIRPADELPIRSDQVETDATELQTILSLREQRIITWEFVDAGTVLAQDAGLEHAGLFARRFGVKTCESVKLAVAHLGWRDGRGRWRSDEVYGRPCLRYAGTLVLVGRPAIPIEQLETPFCDTLAIVPHRSRRGPNGLWLIRRASEHPLEMIFTDKYAYYVTCNGDPVYYSDVSASKNHPATGIDLFLTKKDAQGYADDEEDFYSDGVVRVERAAGTELLKLIAGCDLLSVGNASFALSQTGLRALRHAEGDEAAVADGQAVAAAFVARSHDQGV